LSELDQVWTEVHDLERRVGRVEDDLIREAAQASVRADIADARRARWRWLVPTLAAAIEAVAIVIQTFH
jgi:outer membrane murein-binding lipoprotein Lpp